MNSNELCRMGKRRFIKTAVSMGVATSALKYGSQESVATQVNNHDDHVVYPEVVEYNWPNGYRAPPESEPILTSMPRDEWARRKATLNLAERIQEMIDSWDSPDGLNAMFTPMPKRSPIEFGVQVFTTTVIGRDGKKESASYSVEEVKKRLPDKAKGQFAKGDWKQKFQDIPILVESETKELTFKKSNYSDVPGGSSMSGTASEDAGTVCTTFLDSAEDTKGWLTCAHIFNDERSNDVAKQPSGSSDDFAEVDAYRYTNGEQDYAYIERHDEDVWKSIREPDDPAKTDPIKGRVPDDTLMADAGSSTTYYIQGQSGGRQSGNIQKFVSGSSSKGDERIRHSKVNEKGDSGGPMWKFKNGDVYIAGLMFARADGGDLCCGDNDVTVGNTIEAIEYELDGYLLTK